MKRYLVLALKIAGGFVAAIVVILVAAAFLLNSSSVQNKALTYATEQLRTKLQTKVEIDSIHINFLTFDVNLMGLDVEDRQQRKMLQAEKLSVKLDLWKLVTKKLEIESAEINAVRARLYQPKDSAANFQFVIDAFKSDKPKAEKTDTVKKSKSKLDLDLKKLKVQNIDVVFNEDTFQLEKMTYEKTWLGHQQGEIRHLHGKFDRATKKGEMRTHLVELDHLTLSEKSDHLMADIGDLHFAIDNHLPRKNADKPKRGFFDVGHLDVTSNMQLRINHYGKDTANVTMTKFVAKDSVTGFNVRDLHFTAGINKEKVYLSDVTIQHDSTVLTFDKGELTLPSKKQGRKLTYHTSEISGRTLLKDISRPFAPVLANFTIPLELKVKLSGTDTSMVFRDIHVNTVDNKLKLDADGGMEHFSPKEALNIHFHVKNMTTPTKTAIDIINQFAVKKFMMKQLKALGTINYTGDVQILYKKELFKGLLRTDVGSLNFNVTLDENTKYVLGQVNTSAIHLGKVLEMKDIGDVACNANFTFDMSKPRTAVMRKQKGGKLPIGQVNATVKEASYMKAKVKDVKVKIVSDGAVANGHLEKDSKNIDVLCDFTFTSTDSIHKMKIKPNLKFHNLPWQKKDKGDAKSKEQKKAEKAERKAQKKAEKARKKEEKAQKKAEKANK